MPYGTLAADTLQSSTGNTAPVFRDGNSVEIGQLCKSWLNYNVSTPATRASFNVSSVTKNGTGDYTASYTTSIIDTNYSAVFGGPGVNWGGSYNSPLTVGNNNSSQGTGSLQCNARYTGAYGDPNIACFSVNR